MVTAIHFKSIDSVMVALRPGSCYLFQRKDILSLHWNNFSTGNHCRKSINGLSPGLSYFTLLWGLYVLALSRCSKLIDVCCQLSAYTFSQSLSRCCRCSRVNLGLPRPLFLFFWTSGASCKFSYYGRSAISALLVATSLLPQGHSMQYSYDPFLYCILTGIYPYWVYSCIYYY